MVHRVVRKGPGENVYQSSKDLKEIREQFLRQSREVLRQGGREEETKDMKTLKWKSFCFLEP